MSKSATITPRAKELDRDTNGPVFPRLPEKVRPYVLAVALFAIASALMSAGNSALLRFGFPWALISLLVVAAVANLWGAKPAALVLVLSVLYSAIGVPPLSRFSPADQSSRSRAVLLRTLGFAACGAATVWLTYRARQMQQKADAHREVVMTLQSMILPEALADAPGYDVSGLYKPAHLEEEVGGDFYDFYAIEEGLYGILIGDVMGKGKDAAVSTALLRYSVRAFTNLEMSPAQVMSQLNRLIDNQHEQFVTASLFFGLLDIRSGSLRYANAGHEPPMLIRASGADEILDSTGPILGTRARLEYEERAITLDHEDALLLMTDGVTEARNGSRKFLGTAGARRLLGEALHAATVRESLALLDTALSDYIGQSSRDDIAMLLLRRNPEDSTLPA